MGWRPRRLIAREYLAGSPPLTRLIKLARVNGTGGRPVGSGKAWLQDFWIVPVDPRIIAYVDLPDDEAVLTEECDRAILIDAYDSQRTVAENAAGHQRDSATVCLPPLFTR